MTETSAIDDAVDAIALDAGDDLILLTPPEERHFDPFSALTAFAAVLAVGFMDGFLGHLQEGARSLGERISRRITTGLSRVFGQQPDPSSTEVHELPVVMAEAMRTYDPALVEQALDAARMHLIEALVENGLPPDRALRLSAKVRQEILTALPPRDQ